jgi:hypothetical protein
MDLKGAGYDDVKCIRLVQDSLVAGFRKHRGPNQHSGSIKDWESLD